MFAPAMLKASAMNLRLSTRGTLFSCPISQDVLADTCLNMFVVPMPEFRLEWTMHGYGEGLDHTGYIFPVRHRKHFSLKHFPWILLIHCFAFCTHTPLACCLLSKLANFSTKGTLLTFVFFQVSSQSHRRRSLFSPNVRPSSRFPWALALANNFRLNEAG